MTKLIGATRALRTAVIIMSLLAAGCGSKSSSPQAGAGGVVNIDPKVLLASITTATSNPLNIARSLGGWDWVSFIRNFGTLLTNITYTLEMQKVTYQSTGADGLTHTMTGLLILPKSIFGSKPSVPILLYQHGTEPFRPYSPSQYLSHLDRPADYPEVMVAAAIASTGYAVAMADYEGMGDNTGTQPYVHGTSLAQQVIDMLRASRDIIGGTAGSSSSPCLWNSQLFLMGYSEGGYVTMTTTRELQLHHANEFTVTASAPLSGPHDLSGVMRGVMLSGSTSKAPYFLPFLLTGYSYAYGQTSIFNPLSAMLSPFNATVPPKFDGATPSDKISEAMGMTFIPVNLIVPKSVLTTTFTNLLATDTSTGSAFDFLRRNDSYRVSPDDISTWKPTVPIRMYHHRNDELVPYGNSQAAFNAFSTAGAKKHTYQGPGVELLEERVSLSISSTDPVKTVHLGAAFPELSDGWKWLDGFKK
jgi:pimeloyl-ACP methyl ester carboxylesterase